MELENAADKKLRLVRYDTSVRLTALSAGIPERPASIERFVHETINGKLALSSRARRAEHELSVTSLSLIDKALCRDGKKEVFMRTYKYGPYGSDVWGALTQSNNHALRDLEAKFSVSSMDLGSSINSNVLREFGDPPEQTFRIFAFQLDRFCRQIIKSRDCFDRYLSGFFKAESVNSVLLGF